MFKRIALWALGVLFATCVIVTAKWTDVPNNLAATLFLKDYRGNIEGIVDICPWTWEAVKPLFSNTSATDDEIAEMFRITLTILESQMGTSSRFLYMRVAPWSGHAGDIYWYPWNLVFIQGSRQGSVTMDDILGGFLGEFSGRLYVDGDGFVRLPAWIDYSKPFDIWYDKAKATLGPVTA